MDKRTVFRALLVTTSTVLFCNLVILGECGIQSYLSIKRDIDTQNVTIESLKSDMDGLRSEVDRWKNDKFLVEKVAREDLLLGMKGETVYIIN